MDEQTPEWVKAAQTDPRQQYYLRNLVTGRLIRSNQQYHHALENKDQLETINYGQALALYRKEEAEKKQARIRVFSRKAKKQARKNNRPK